MNGAIPSSHVDEGNEGGSDYDSDSSAEESPEHYQPISAVDGGDSDQSNSDEDRRRIISSDFHPLENGYVRGAEAGVSRLHLRDCSNSEEEDREEEEEEEEEEEAEEADSMMLREASDLAILRAFREDESRRSAPLEPENALRVREAMRGVSFPEWAPEWALGIPEERWIDQLRRLRQPPSNPAASLQN